MSGDGLKSCASCIFNLDESKALETTGEDIQAKMCLVGRGPLTIPSYSPAQNRTAMDVKGANCPDYSKEGPHPGSELFTRLREGAKVSGASVLLPDIKALDASETPSPVIMSCLQCANYIPPEQMLEQGLWNAGACAARGILIGKRDVVSVAKVCGRRRLGPRDDTVLQRMTLVPEFTTIGVVSAADVAREAEVKHIVEPTTYETDKEVTDADKALGIRAWRRVPDPERPDSGEVYLPIFDIEFFSPEEREAIPRTGDDEHPEEYVDHMGLTYKAAVLWMHLQETPALWGVAGTGKTEFYRYMAWMMCLPFGRISITASTEVEDLAGKMHYEPSRGTYFEYGRIPRAWQKPGVICLDEPNVGPPDVWQFIRPLTDNSKQLVLDMNNGERISRHPNAYLGLAMNPAWDVRNSGTLSLADADGSRLMHIFVELPDAATERKIIKDRCKIDGYDIEDDTLDSIMSIAKELRALCDNDTLPITWGIRPQIKVARATRFFKLSTAYRLATADYLEPEQQQIIMDTVKSHSISRPKPPRQLFGTGTVNTSTAVPVESIPVTGRRGPRPPSYIKPPTPSPR